jgi:hypothetical protein
MRKLIAAAKEAITTNIGGFGPMVPMQRCEGLKSALVAAWLPTTSRHHIVERWLR